MAAFPEKRRAAYTRWRAPHVVDQRVAALAAVIRRRVTAMPPLTAEQLHTLTSAVDGGGQR